MNNLLQQHGPIELLTKQEITELIEILNRKYAAYLKDRFFDLKVSADDSFSRVTILLRNSEGTTFYPVESFVDHKNQDINPKDAGLLALDYIDIYFNEFFESDESTFIPIDWSSFAFDGFELYMRGQIYNAKAEEDAAKLLGDEYLEEKQIRPTQIEAEGFINHWKL